MDPKFCGWITEAFPWLHNFLIKSRFFRRPVIMMNRYVCAFAGRRDSYQVPMALSQADLLERFITDAYATPPVRALARLLPGRVREKTLLRYNEIIPNDRISCLWGTFAREHVRHWIGVPRSLTYAKMDQHYSWAAEKVARQTGANLFLYASYAWEAFTAAYPHQPRRVMFQYHPHPDFERAILSADYAQHPYVTASYGEAVGANLDETLRRRERDCWRHADLIICASGFTRSSLIEAGADPHRCRVVPYGIDLTASGQLKAPETFQAVFVGSGVQRKGLHHLLTAWSRASLPKGSQLILICRNSDPELERRAHAVPGVELINGVPPGKLQEVYGRSALFVMPSLVEGFGQVYLEALAQGCPVLGTPNSCLPELGGEPEGVFITSPGNIDELVAKLESLASLLVRNLPIRLAARACAERFPWRHFRQRLLACLAE
jgi:glycosyltransferase involved in cell wall biosynthesis